MIVSYFVVESPCCIAASIAPFLAGICLFVILTPALRATAMSRIQLVGPEAKPFLPMITPARVVKATCNARPETTASWNALHRPLSYLLEGPYVVG